jgi:mycofactocin precursor
MADETAADFADEAAAPRAVATVPAGDLVQDGLAGDDLAADVLVEEVSIDGMCGVY